MDVRIYLIRHGETEDASPRRYKGHLDIPLSEKGVRQIEELSRYIVQDSLRWFKIVQNSSGLDNIEPRLMAVYCSDLSRALQSAEIIARAFGLKPIVLRDLRERSFGEWEGMSFDEIEERWPDAFRAWAENPLKHSPPGGESTIEVRRRVMRAMKRIMEDGRRKMEDKRFPSSIAIVAHGGVNRIILCELLGMPLENIFRIEQDYACLNIIDFHDGYPVVKALNVV
jgi:alpha-ribazole phosphatase/probable phosphoglycerate mutase